MDDVVSLQKKPNRTLMGCGIGCGVMALLAFLICIVAIVYFVGSGPLPDPKCFVFNGADGFIAFEIKKDDENLMGLLSQWMIRARAEDQKNLPPSLRDLAEKLQSQTNNPRALRQILPARIACAFQYAPPTVEEDSEGEEITFQEPVPCVLGLAMNAYGRTINTVINSLARMDKAAQIHRGQTIISLDTNSFIAGTSSGLVWSSQMDLMKESLDKVTGKTPPKLDPELKDLSSRLKSGALLTACLSNETGALTDYFLSAVDARAEEESQGDQETGESPTEDIQADEIQWDENQSEEPQPDETLVDSSQADGFQSDVYLAEEESPGLLDRLKEVWTGIDRSVIEERLMEVRGISGHASLQSPDVLKGTGYVFCDTQDSLELMSELIDGLAERIDETFAEHGSRLTLSQRILDSESTIEIDFSISGLTRLEAEEAGQ